jgi:calcium permeable stress-gated cation channel
MSREMMTFTMNGVDVLLQMQRFLDDLNSTDSTIDGNSTNSTGDGNSTATPDDSAPTEKESLILKGTFTTYGSVFVVVFFLLCVLRQRFPRAFNLRSWVEDIQSDLANQQYGFLSWTWQIWMIPDVRLMDECGLDAVCFQRVCALGIKLSMVGMVGALFLMPSYATAPKVPETINVTDWVVMLTTANVGPGSKRLIATVVAAWIVFALTMWLIVKEMEWITAMRHRFLRKKLPRNYAVYVRNIPEVYQSSHALKHFFERSLGVELLEGHIAVKTMNLQKAIAQRAVTVSQLEHAVAEEEAFGRRPRHKVGKLIIVPVPGILGGETVDSIDYYAKQLKAENKDITERINSLRGEADRDLIRSFISADDEVSSSEEADETGFLNFVHSSARSVVLKVAENTTTVANGATGLVASATTQAVNLLAGNEDGQIYSAGFVVFKKLSTVQRALRLTHYEKPYFMECLEAPEPEDIFWFNVGRQHKDLQLGMLFSLAATSATCLLWTIPVSFVSSLSSVEALRTQFEGIDDMLTAGAWMLDEALFLADRLERGPFSYCVRFSSPLLGACF